MEKVVDEWVSRGWNELEHKGWVFKTVSCPPLKDTDSSRSTLSDTLVSQGFRSRVLVLGFRLVVTQGAPHVQGLGPLPLPKAVFNNNLLECHDKTSDITFYFSGHDTASLTDWHKEMGPRLGPQCYDFTYDSLYSGSIDKNKEILREKLRLACVSLCVAHDLTHTHTSPRNHKQHVCASMFCWRHPAETHATILTVHTVFQENRGS